MISAAQNSKRVQPPVDLDIDVCGCSVTPKPFIRDIGFVFDDTMTMAAQNRRYAASARWHTVTFAALQLSENAFPPLLAKQLFML